MSDQEKLIRVLKSLLLSQFNEVVFRLEEAFPLLSAEIPSQVAPLAERAKALVATLIDAPNGLERLKSAIDAVVPALANKL